MADIDSEKEESSLKELRNNSESQPDLLEETNVRGALKPESDETGTEETGTEETESSSSFSSPTEKLKESLKTFKLKTDEIPNIRDAESKLGPEWCGIFETEVTFKLHHFIAAMTNLIKEPNINSTVILRADILKEYKYLYNSHSNEPTVSEYINPDPEFRISEENGTVLTKDLSDLEIHDCPLSDQYKPSLQVVRRIIPRNPSKDYIINQTCLILNNASDNSTLVIYTPHIDNPEDVPFYLPPVKSIGILYQNGRLSIHYLPFEQQTLKYLKEMEPTERPIRIAYRLLNTARKHSTGVMNGYQKRVNHDLVVSKTAFQDRYISLKQKYAKVLVDNWSESTDPRKHVFEDIAIAAFLIEFWTKIYKRKDSFEFRDLGCGNGLLVYILSMEGYKGIGIDARARKSWRGYPSDIQLKLKEQVIIPSVLLRPHPAIRSMAPHLTDNGMVFKVPLSNNNINNANRSTKKRNPNYKAEQKLKSDENNNEDNINVRDNNNKQDGETTNKDTDDSNSDYEETNENKIPMVACYTSADLLSSPFVNTAEFPKNTFIIGNHSDELTCWIPLLGFPFLVLPCCSHNLNGDKIRFNINKKMQHNNKVTAYSSTSRYAALVDHVEELATMAGWKIEREMLRIPSTRNAAVIGYQPDLNVMGKSIYEMLSIEGGADRWVENTMALMKKPPRDH
ncbi:hypothetical protein B5S33_g4629 [[Candida] boidinii]|nr:hypothetical protein B5S30_g4154 [[Candida] boidinii]OWB85953.1 hypothetical protein B5S33_g4629 [[Candida] boidinii]